MIAYAVAVQKGGTAKTTTAHNLAAYLAAKGKKVLAVDLDSQANLSQVLGAEAGHAGAYSILTKKAAVEDTIQASNIQGVDIIPASQELSFLDTELRDETGREYRLAEALASVKKKYDFMVFDCAPSLGQSTINALTAANKVIIPSQADAFGLEALKLFLVTLDSVKRYTTNKKLVVDGILLTRFKANTNVAKKALVAYSSMAKAMASKVYATTIRESVAVKVSQLRKESVFTYKAGKTPVAQDYAKAFAEVLKDIEK